METSDTISNTYKYPKNRGKMTTDIVKSNLEARTMVDSRACVQYLWPLRVIGKV